MKRTVKDVADRVDAIIGMGNADPEASHGEEDRLALEVFHSIVTDGSNAQELAWEMIRLLGREDATRWYA